MTCWIILQKAWHIRGCTRQEKLNTLGYRILQIMNPQVSSTITQEMPIKGRLSRRTLIHLIRLITFNKDIIYFSVRISQL